MGRPGPTWRPVASPPTADWPPATPELSHHAPPGRAPARPQAPVLLAAGNGTPGPTPAVPPLQQQLADLEGKAGRIRRALAALQA